MAKVSTEKIWSLELYSADCMILGLMLGMHASGCHWKGEVSEWRWPWTTDAQSEGTELVGRKYKTQVAPKCVKTAGTKTQAMSEL